MSLQPHLRYLFVGLCFGLMMAGCATVEVKIDGRGQNLRWHVTDLRQYIAADERREIYEYTLVLLDLRGTAVTFTHLQAKFRNNFRSRPFDWQKSGEWRLPARGELRIPLGTYRHCRVDHCRDWGPIAPIWHLQLTGMDEQGEPVREVIEMALPVVIESS